jgi:hypothetical protein
MDFAAGSRIDAEEGENGQGGARLPAGFSHASELRRN